MAYLLCEKELKEGGYEGVLLELDLQTGRTRELKSRGWRLALSPDERRVVMLDGSKRKRNETMTLVKLNFVDVETGLEGCILRRFVQTDQGKPYRFILLKSNLFAVAMEYQPGAFIFIDLKEGEGK